MDNTDKKSLSTKELEELINKGITVPCRVITDIDEIKEINESAVRRSKNHRFYQDKQPKHE